MPSKVNTPRKSTTPKLSKQPSSVIKSSHVAQTLPRLVSVHPTMDSEAHLKPRSSSRIEDLCMCPTWGIVHGQRRYKNAARSMALEAGELMHKVFAMVRIWQLWRVDGRPRHAEKTAHRIFGKELWDIIKEKGKGFSERDELLAMCFAVLHESNWEDDPKDTIRSMSNMETATIDYVDERLPVMKSWPIWVADVSDSNSQVGIEQVFDVVLQYEDDYKIRYIGTVDGLVLDASRSPEVPTLEDNKTASRLDSAFQMATHMKYQFTGYMACSTAVFGIQVFHGRVVGVKIRRTNTGENYVSLPIERDYDAIEKWAYDIRWYVQNMYEPFGDAGFEDAPRFTHSCNRFFRPCSLIPFCTDSPEGRRIAFDSEMVPVTP